MAAKSAKLKVDDLPTSITESHLYTVLGNKKRKGGGTIDNIKFIKNGEIRSAIVTFEVSEAVDLILRRGDTLEIRDVTVKVQRYFESCERKSSFTPPRNAPDNSETSKIKHSSQDASASKKKQSKAKSEKDDAEQNSDIDNFSETTKSKKSLGKRTSGPSEEAKLHRKRSTNISQSTDDDDESSTHSSSSESPREKFKNVKDKSVRTSSTKKERPLANKACSGQNKQTKSQRRKSNTQTRTSDSKHISDNDDLSGSDSSADGPKYPTRKSSKVPAEVRKSSVAKSQTSSSQEDSDDEESKELWKVTIKAKVKDLGKSKDFYLYYFEDKKISQGPFYEESLMLDVLHRNLYVTFHTRKAALATVNFKHKPESNLLKFEMAKEEDFDTHTNLLSVHGQHCDTDQQRKALMETVAEQTKMKVVNIIQQDEPRSAIIVFDPETCPDVSAATWTPLVFNQVYLILAPVFKTNCVKVSNLYALSSDDTLRRYMSNTDRSCGGEVAYFKRQSPVEALVTFKEGKDFDGFLGKSEHMVENCKLDVKTYYQCLSPEAYKLIDQLVRELNNAYLVNKSHHVQHPITQAPLVQESSSLHTLNCTFGPVYTSVISSLSKTMQYTLQLCKFGTDFLTRSQHVQELMHIHHCKYILPQEGNGCIVLSLDWPTKISFKEVKNMLDSGIKALREYLDTFRVAKCYIDKSHIHEFQKFSQMKCQQEKPIIEAFFDHTDNSAVFISNRSEAGLKHCVNTMYHNFMSHFPKFEGAAIKSPLKQSENSPIPKARKNKKQQSGYNDNNDKERKDEVKAVVTEKPKLNMEQMLDLEEKDIILFQKTNFHKEVEKNNKPMEITFNLETYHAIIKGINKDSINCAQTELLKKAREFLKLSVSSLFSPEQLQLLNKKDVQDRINKLFEENGHHAHFKYNTDEALLIYVKVNDIVDTVLKEIIKSHVVIKTKPIDSDMAFILKSEKGQKFLSGLCESTDGLRMSSLVKLQEKCLQIISSSQHLDALMNLVDHFAEENKSYEKKIQFSSGKQLFLKKFYSSKLSKITESLTTLGAKIIYNAESITVQGLKDGVNQGETQLTSLSEQILVQDITLKYFGIKEFLQTTEGRSLLPSVEKNNTCIVTLPSTNAQTGPSGVSKAFPGMQAQPAKQPNLIAHVKVGECSLLFMQGDITSLQTEAIVNPIDSSLKCQTGLGKALILRGGHQIQAELASHNLQGNPGEVAETSAGNLDTCKRVVHVVCPVFTGTEVDALDVAIKRCLKHTEMQGIQSLAIPAMGTGMMFKFPPIVACKLLMKSLHKLVTATTTKLTKIIFCDAQADNVKELIERFQNVFGVSVDAVGELDDTTSKATTGPPVSPRPVQVNKTPKSFKNIKVNLITGEITKQKTDVIVVTVGKSLELSKGGITKDIVKYGGDTVQQELIDNCGPEIQPGDLGTTSGGNLQCKNIYYARLNHWRGKEEDHMQKLVKKMLHSADQQEAASISIPALGTGRLGYPPDVAADAIINAISQFDKDYAKSSLKLVNLVVYKTDANVKQAFETALSTGGGPRGAEGGTTGFFQPRKKAATGDKSNIKKFNSVKLTITKGDITAEKCDAIISGVRDSLDMSNSGAVCKALLKQCGSALQDECSAKLTEMTQKGFIATSAPNLNCKHIYHVSMDKFSRSWNRCISQVLAEAESQGLTSIALPALGTGARHADYQQIKQTIFSGVNYFSRSSKGVLTDVRLVVFSQEILDAFLSEEDSRAHAARSNNEGDTTPTQSVMKVSEHVDLKVYAESHPKIVSATKELNTVFTNAVKEEKDKNKKYQRLKKHQVRQVEMEGMQHCVKVSVSIEEGLVTMKGFRAEGFMPVVRLINNLVVDAVENHHKSLQQAVEAIIQWQFDQQGKWRNFEPILNSELEKEFKNKSKHHDVTDSRNRTYRIDFSSMKEFQLDENGQKCGHSFKVRRHDRSKEGEALPNKWEFMGDTDNLKLVTLQAGSTEYKNAESMFIKGGANMPIKKIQRIQNKSLYQQYKAKKRELDNRNPKGHVNERKLFHGTDSDSVTAINTAGFNRSYCGKNATVYGNGVYFAVNSSYSVGFARQSAQGERHMYIVRVLTGVSIPSQSGMTHLPNMPGTNIPYDSGSASDIFIIFHDSHAYPEYLITF